MRFILVFIIGLLASFYLSALFKRLFKTKAHSLVGFIAIALSILLGIIGSFNPLYTLIAFFLGGSGVGIITHHLLA